MKPAPDGAGHPAGLPSTRHCRRHPHLRPRHPYLHSQGIAMPTTPNRHPEGRPSDWYVPRPGVTRRTAARVLALICTSVLCTVLAAAVLGLSGCGGGGDQAETLAGTCYVAGQPAAPGSCTPTMHLPAVPASASSR